MKKMAFYAALIAFIGCNSVENIHAPDIEKWKLKDRVAKRMIKKNDPAGVPSIKDPNTAVHDELAKNYVLTSVQAKYIRINRRDYGILRNVTGDTTKVRGYTTTIYKAESTTKPAVAKAYYDIVTICPPPRSCSR